MKEFVLVPSSVEKQWYEIRGHGVVVREVKILFPLKKVPRTFSDVEAVLSWLSETERKQAKTRAYWLLGRQSYPRGVLQAKLEEKGYSERVCEEVVTELEQLGYLNDRDYWIRFIEREFAKGYGPRAIEWKGKPKGMPEGLAREQISTLMQRKKIAELKKKGLAALARRGFDPELLIEIFRR
jgi:SOS response regulatory protein OraA/RecX